MRSEGQAGAFFLGEDRVQDAFGVAAVGWFTLLQAVSMPSERDNR